MPDIVITEFMDDAAVAALSADFDTVYDPTLADRQADIPALLKDTRALIVRNRTLVTETLLESAPVLRAVGRLGVGLDNIETEACKARDVAVWPATGANNASVAEYVITATLILTRGAWLRSADVAAGAWPRQQMMGGEVAGRTLALVGYGGIARETAACAKALGMHVIGHDPFLQPDAAEWGSTRSVDMETAFREADTLSLHTPLTEGTRNLVNAARLATMKPDANVINAARGGVVDEEALASALRANKLGGAALDVFETEPLTAESGRIWEGLNVLLTPHIAGVTGESNIRVSAMIAQKIKETLSDR